MINQNLDISQTYTILVARGNVWINVWMNVWTNVWNTNIFHAFVKQNIYLVNISWSVLNVCIYLPTKLLSIRGTSLDMFGNVYCCKGILCLVCIIVKSITTVGLGRPCKQVIQNTSVYVCLGHRITSIRSRTCFLNRYRHSWVKPDYPQWSGATFVAIPFERRHTIVWFLRF